VPVKRAAKPKRVAKASKRKRAKAAALVSRAKPKPPRVASAANRVAATVPAEPSTGTSPLLIALLGLGLGLAALAVVAAATPLRILPYDTAVLLDEKRVGLALGGVACMIALGLGLLIALAG
jgi:hypothetical protein